MSLQQLCLPAKDLHSVKPVNIPPLPEELVTVGGFRGSRVSFFMRVALAGERCSKAWPYT